MSFKFKPAEREGVHLILGFMGGTGSGKTYSALEVATGLAGGKRFAVIDTEAGRAKHYADDFDFDHGDLGPPFAPSRYLEAILAAEEDGYPVVVVDSFSHEHAGEGGILDMHDAEHKRLGGKESTKMLAWVKPKGQHKRMVARVLQLRIHLILCFRAEPKLKMVKVGKKTEIVAVGWQPICAKNLDFEMAASFMLNNDTPGHVVIGEIARKADESGLGRALKLPKPLREIFTGTFALSRQHGQQLAEWAGGVKKFDPQAFIKSRYASVERKAITAAIKQAKLKSSTASEADIRKVLDPLLDTTAKPAPVDEDVIEAAGEPAQAESSVVEDLANDAFIEAWMTSTGYDARKGMVTTALRDAMLVGPKEHWYNIKPGAPRESIVKALEGLPEIE